MKDNIVSISNFDSIKPEEIPNLAQEFIKQLKTKIKAEIQSSIKNSNTISIDYFDVFIQDVIEQAKYDQSVERLNQIIEAPIV